MLKDCSQCLHNDQNVSDHRPVVDIREIEANGFIPRQIGSATYLPQTGNTGLNEQPPLHITVVGFNFSPQWRTGTDDTHLLSEHVDELWQFIDAETPQHTTYGRYARIARILKRRPSLSLWSTRLSNCLSASSTIVRNFSIENGLPSIPMRSAE